MGERLMAPDKSPLAPYIFQRGESLPLQKGDQGGFANVQLSPAYLGEFRCQPN
jgi:hypothetical protein